MPLNEQTWEGFSTNQKLSTTIGLTSILSPIEDLLFLSLGEFLDRRKSYYTSENQEYSFYGLLEQLKIFINDHDPIFLLIFYGITYIIPLLGKIISYADLGL
jgi:hypothetical protein